MSNVPVHAFYLFDAKVNRYVRAKALEAAIGGRDIDRIDNGRFVLRANQPWRTRTRSSSCAEPGRARCCSAARRARPLPNRTC